MRSLLQNTENAAYFYPEKKKNFTSYKKSNTINLKIMIND